jgi:hypothetical protein
MAPIKQILSYFHKQQLLQQGRFILSLLCSFLVLILAVCHCHQSVSDSNATVLSHCLLSLSKSVLYSFLVSDSVYDDVLSAILVKKLWQWQKESEILCTHSQTYVWGFQSHYVVAPPASTGRLPLVTLFMTCLSHKENITEP